VKWKTKGGLRGGKLNRSTGTKKNGTRETGRKFSGRKGCPIWKENGARPKRGRGKLRNSDGRKLYQKSRGTTDAKCARVIPGMGMQRGSTPNNGSKTNLNMVPYVLGRKEENVSTGELPWKSWGR